MIKKISVCLFLYFSLFTYALSMMGESQFQEDQFYKELNALKQSYPQLIKGHQEIHDRSKIENFIKKNKKQCIDLVSKKMNKIVNDVQQQYPIDKGGFTSIQAHEQAFHDAVKKKSFKDDDISFLHNIEGYRKPDGKFSGTLVASNFAKMHSSIDNLFKPFRESMKMPQIQESKQQLNQSPQTTKQISNSTELDIPFSDILIQVKPGTVSETENVDLSIKQISEHNELLKNSIVFNLSTQLSNVFEILPHDKKFNQPILITFPQIRKIDRPGALYGLFIQKTEVEAHDLDEWKILLDYDHDMAHPNFNLKSFSFMFLGDLQHTVPVTLKDDPLLKNTPKHQWIHPGLSLASRCPNTSCEGYSGMVVNLGFGKDIRLNEKLDGEEICCPICETPLDYEQIEKIMIFNAKGNMKYKLNGKGNKIKSRKINPEPQEKNSLKVYGATEQGFENYSSLIFNIKSGAPQANNTASREEIEEKIIAGSIKIDEAGNPVGSIYDLGADKSCENINLLVGHFYDPAWGPWVDSALDQKGFSCEINMHRTQDENNFLQELQKNDYKHYDVVWIIDYSGDSKSQIQDNNFVDQVNKYLEHGGNLLLWEDDNPKKGTHVMSLLEKRFNGMTLEGCNPADKIMTPSDITQNKTLTFDHSHDIFTGIRNLYEGWTICHPENNHPDFKTIAISSDGQPNIMVIERNTEHGRIVLDTGCTKLFDTWWTKSAVERYVKNVSCWLAGASCERRQ